jgi:hypothetical protein
MDIVSTLEADCPYCGEPIVISVDTLQGNYSTIEDCSVCCRPIQYNVECEPGEILSFDVSPA